MYIKQTSTDLFIQEVLIYHPSGSAISAMAPNLGALK